MHSLINKQTLSRLSNVTAQLSPTEMKHIFTLLRQMSIAGSFSRTVALPSSTNQVKNFSMFSFSCRETHTDSRADHSSHETCLFERKPALYLAPLRSLAVQISRYRLRSTCFPMDRTARLDRPLLLRPIDGNMRFTTSTSHCSFILKKNRANTPRSGLARAS